MIVPAAIDHVCLAVSDIARSRDYYERVLGARCRVREGDPDGIRLECVEVFA